MPASSTIGPNVPRLSTSKLDTIVDAPVFSKAVDIGIMAAISTILSQFMVLYAASTLRKQPVRIIKTLAMSTAVTGATGMKSNTISTIISSMMAAANGAL